MIALILWSAAALGADAPPAPDFETQVIPVLTRAGCNAGACHGAAAGRGGFGLSLFGSRPDADYEAIVHAFEGRRVDLAEPARSLLLTKPTEQLSHGGGQALAYDSSGVERLKQWIAAGAPRGNGRRLVQFELVPASPIKLELGQQISVRAIARFSDEQTEDVSDWAVWTPTDPAAIVRDPSGVISAKRQGQQTLLIRFLDRIEPLEVRVPYGNAADDFRDRARANFIDDRVLEMLAELRLPVSPPASDEIWLRRVTLDLTGRLPTLAESDAFLEETSAHNASDRATSNEQERRDAAQHSVDTRERVVDRLLASSAFVDYWTLWLARLVHLHSLPNEPQAVAAYSAWLRKQVADDRRLDEVARDLLLATGDSHTIGPANFSRMVVDARQQAELVGQLFLGVRLACANCHNHPLDRWTQDDYHGLAAVFARLDRGQQVRWTTRGAVTNLRTGEPAIPRIPGDRDVPASDDPRRELADWLLAPEQPIFARVLVNRLWSRLFGRGLIDPMDDLRQTNPATHPELLRELTADLVRHEYSLRQMLRRIVLSQTYARSPKVLPGNAAEDRFYSRVYARPLGPEVLADALADVTGVPDERAGQLAGRRAVTQLDPLVPAPSLDLLGRCARVATCEGDLPGVTSLAAQLHLLNGPLLNRSLVETDNRLGQQIAAGLDDDAIVLEFYRRALGRSPSMAEARNWHERLERAAAAARDERRPAPRARREALEDFLWSLLNSREFRENH